MFAGVRAGRADLRRGRRGVGIFARTSATIGLAKEFTRLLLIAYSANRDLGAVFVFLCHDLRWFPAVLRVVRTADDRDFRPSHVGLRLTPEPGYRLLRPDRRKTKTRPRSRRV